MRQDAVHRLKVFHKRSVHIIRQNDQVRILFHHLYKACQRLFRQRMGCRVRRIDQEKRLHGRVLQLGQLCLRDIPLIRFRACDVHRHQPVILHRRNLHVGREDRRADGDLVSRLQQTVVTERLKDIHHGRASALRGKDLRFPGQVHAVIQRGLQIRVQDLLNAGQTAAGCRIVITDRRIRQFLQQHVPVHAQGLDAPVHGAEQECVHIVFRVHGGLETLAYAFLPRMPRHGALTHVQFTFPGGKVAETGKGIACLCIDPVGVASSRIQNGISRFIVFCQFPLIGGNLKSAKLFFKLQLRLLLQRNDTRAFFRMHRTEAGHGKHQKPYQDGRQDVSIHLYSPPALLCPFR